MKARTLDPLLSFMIVGKTHAALIVSLRLVCMCDSDLHMQMFLEAKTRRGRPQCSLVNDNITIIMIIKWSLEQRSKNERVMRVKMVIFVVENIRVYNSNFFP